MESNRVHFGTSQVVRPQGLMGLMANSSSTSGFICFDFNHFIVAVRNLFVRTQKYPRTPRQAVKSPIFCLVLSKVLRYVMIKRKVGFVDKDLPPSLLRTIFVQDMSFLPSQKIGRLANQGFTLVFQARILRPHIVWSPYTRISKPCPVINIACC